MTIDEIYKEALRLMFANYEDDLDADGLTIDNIGNESYQQYLRNMRGAVNRCFAAIEREDVLSPKRLTIRAHHGDGALVTTLSGGVLLLGNTTENEEIAMRLQLGIEVGDYRNKYDMATLASGYLSIERVIEESATRYQTQIEYTMEGDTLVLAVPPKDGAQIVLYKWRIPRVPKSADYTYNVDLSDDLCELIPYYIKSELYEEDEPQQAIAARNYFEAGLDRLRRLEGGQTVVEDAFGFRW